MFQNIPELSRTSRTFENIQEHSRTSRTFENYSRSCYFMLCYNTSPFIKLYVTTVVWSYSNVFPLHWKHFTLWSALSFSGERCRGNHYTIFSTSTFLSYLYIWILCQLSMYCSLMQYFILRVLYLFHAVFCMVCSQSFFYSSILYSFVLSLYSIHFYLYFIVL
jgi:hypothetical protein